MPRMHDRDPKPGEADRRRPTQRAEDGGGHEADRHRIESLSQAAGNAAVSRMLDPGVSRAIESDLGSGRALSNAAPAAPEAGGVDPSQVRVHDDPRAASLARSLDAVAFTYGSDIFLAGDAPALGSPEGQRVLAHELTHVRQQDGAPAGPPTQVSSPESPAEQEATRVGDGVGAAATAQAGSIHRQEVEEEELAMMAAGTVHRQEMEEEEMVMEMPAGTVHRQGDEEEEIALMEAGTVHRQEAAVEEEVEVEDEPAPEPANAALAAMFQSTVIDRFDLATELMGESPPDAARALDEVVEAWSSMVSLQPIYEESDPLLHSDISRGLNALGMYQEAISPIVNGPRSAETIAAAMPDAGFHGVAASIRDRLH